MTKVNKAGDVKITGATFRNYGDTSIYLLRMMRKQLTADLAKAVKNHREVRSIRAKLKDVTAELLIREPTKHVLTAGLGNVGPRGATNVLTDTTTDVKPRSWKVEGSKYLGILFILGCGVWFFWG